MTEKHDLHVLLKHSYAGITGLISLWIYVKTLAPTVSFFDSGELISAAYTMGIAHPPGYPLYVLLGWLFSHLPLGSNAAWRLNLMSAVFGALAAVMVYYLTYLLLDWRRGASPLFGARTSCPPSLSGQDARAPKPSVEWMLYPVIAMITALLFAFSHTHWRQAVIAEVYTLNAFLCGLILLLLLTWRHAHLSLDNCQLSIKRVWLLYLTAFLFGLGFGNHQTISLFAVPAVFLVLITCPGILLKPRVILLIFAALMLGFSIYLLVPLRAAHNPAINWGNPTTWTQFEWLVTRAGYSNVPHGDALATLWHGLFHRESGHSVFQVLSQSLFLKQVQSFHPIRELGVMGFALIVLGIVYGFIVRRVETGSLLLAVFAFVLIVVIIGDAPEENIFLVEEFHTPAYLALSVCVGLGAIAITRALLWIASKSKGLQYAIVLGLAGYFLVLPGAQMLGNLKAVDRCRNYVAYDYATNILQSLAPDALLFTWGDSGAFPLWYLQIVEGERPDVTLIHVPHLGSAWYLDLLPPSLFRDVAPLRRYSGNMGLLLDEIVQQNIGSRPIYFDYSSAHSINLPYPLIPYGITYKVAVQGDTLDEKVWDHYRFRGILDDVRIARDPDVNRTFILYGAVHIELGNYYLEHDELEKATRAFNKAVQFEPTLGNQILQELQFRNMLAPEPPQKPGSATQ